MSTKRSVGGSTQSFAAITLVASTLATALVFAVTPGCIQGKTPDCTGANAAECSPTVGPLPGADADAIDAPSDTGRGTDAPIESSTSSDSASDAGTLDASSDAPRG